MGGAGHGEPPGALVSGHLSKSLFACCGAGSGEAIM